MIEPSARVRSLLNECRFLRETYERFSNLNNVGLPAVATTPGHEVLSYFVSGALDLEFDENVDKVSSSIDAQLQLVSKLELRVVELTVLIKLKTFYIGALVDKLSAFFRDRSHAENTQAMQVEVNDNIFKVLQHCAPSSLVAAMPDDPNIKKLASNASKSNMQREFFRQWKFRLSRFFSICSIERKLLFTDLSLTQIVRTFPDPNSTMILFDYIRTHSEEYPDWLTP